jgi:hypothetical protein
VNKMCKSVWINRDNSCICQKNAQRAYENSTSYESRSNFEHGKVAKTNALRIKGVNNLILPLRA